MSDEKLLKHFNEITKEYHQHCEWTDDKYSAVERIRQIIQQKPEIVPIAPNPICKGCEYWADSICTVEGDCPRNPFVKQQKPEIDDHRNHYAIGPKAMLIQQKPTVDHTFVENWRKRFFLLLIKFEEKGLLDDDDRTVLKALEVNLDNFISEMLTEAKVEIKK